MPFALEPATPLGQLLARLPKTETHLHIEGALPYALLQGLDPVQYAALPASYADDFRYPDFPSFEQHLLGLAVPWFNSAERYHQAARAIFARQVAQGVRYVETSFHAGIVEFLGIPGPEIVDAIRRAAPPGLEVRVFLGMLRTQRQGKMVQVLDEALHWPGLTGIDLHGLESLPMEGWTADYWAAARAAGLVTKAHAGEFGPAANVREAVEVLGARRIQHGIHAADDPTVIALCAAEQVVFDICPISNVKLAVVSSLAAHPLRRFVAAGIRCTISTDDPLVFGNSLTEEYARLHLEGGYSLRELAGLARTGFEIALAPAAWKAPILAEIDALAAALPPAA